MSSTRDKILFGFVIAVIVFVAYGIATSESTTETRLVETAEIYSLSLNTNNEMNFVLGTGSSRLDVSYYFFKEWDEGKRLDSIDASITKIIETDEQTPTLRRFETERYGSFYSVSSISYVEYYNELIVPVNTTQTIFRAEM